MQVSEIERSCWKSATQTLFQIHAAAHVTPATGCIVPERLPGQSGIKCMSSAEVHEHVAACVGWNAM